MLIRILLDEHISPRIAYRLNAVGFDVVPLRDRGLLEWDDWDLLDWCLEDRRAICTRDSADFRREHQRRQDNGATHAGILLIGDEWLQEEIYWALYQFLLGGPDPDLLANQLLELPAATPEFVQAHSAPSEP